jgi:hypothetical protein
MQVLRVPFDKFWGTDKLSYGVAGNGAFTPLTVDHSVGIVGSHSMRDIVKPGML